MVLRFKFEFRMSSGPTKDEILDVLPKELTDNVVTQKDREKYSHILRKFSDFGRDLFRELQI